MKTKNIIAAILISTLTVSVHSASAKSNADHFQLTEEKYIDDIPFNTAKIFDSLQNLKADQSVFALTEEAYIDDIPFDTEIVVANYHCCVAMQQQFAMQPESYINDIPFNTHKIAREAMNRIVFFASKELK